MEQSNYVFTRIFLFVIAVLIAIVGAVFIYKVLNGADTSFQFIINLLESSNNNSYTNESSEVLSDMKLSFAISIIYIVVFWISLIILPIIFSVILNEGEINIFEIILRIIGFVFISFGIITFIYILIKDDIFNNIQWIQNFRLGLGFIFLVFNLFHGFICLGTANIHHLYCNSGSLDDMFLEFDNKKENLNLEQQKSHEIID